MKKKPIIVSKGSNFRYAGKTQEELKSSVTPTKNPQYERKTSMRKPKVAAKDKQDYKHLHSQSEEPAVRNQSEAESVQSSSPLASPLPPPDQTHVPTAMINDIIKDAEKVSFKVPLFRKLIKTQDSSKCDTRTQAGKPRRLRYNL